MYDDMEDTYTPTVIETWAASLLPDPLDAGIPDLDGAEVVQVDRYGTVVAATDELVYKGNASGNDHLCAIGIPRQYTAMTGLNRIVPERVPDVHAAYRDDDGVVRAYTMARAPGKPAGAYYTHHRIPRARPGLAALDVPAIATALHSLLDDLEDAGWAHGDLNPGNVALDPPATVTVYDPDFEPETFRDRSLDAVQDRDRDHVDALIDALSVAQELDR